MSQGIFCMILTLDKFPPRKLGILVGHILQLIHILSLLIKRGLYDPKPSKSQVLSRDCITPVFIPLT
jgi:hypothetical protein